MHSKRKRFFSFCLRSITLMKYFLRLRSPRSISPQRATQASRPHSRNVSPSFADSTFSAVHAALNKRQVQVSVTYSFVLFRCVSRTSFLSLSSLVSLQSSPSLLFVCSLSTPFGIFFVFSLTCLATFRFHFVGNLIIIWCKEEEYRTDVLITQIELKKTIITTQYSTDLFSLFLFDSVDCSHFVCHSYVNKSFGWSSGTSWWDHF